MSSLKTLKYCVAIVVSLLFSIHAQAVLIDGINYTLNSNGTATVIPGSTNTSGSVMIPSAVISSTYEAYYVTSISSYAFENCRNMTSVTIPYTIESIGSYAFCGCSSLMTFTNYSNALTTINAYTFSGCKSLNYFTIPGTITRIGNDAFSECSSLQSIVIPNSVTMIGEYAFAGCTQLSSFSVPRSVTSLVGNVISGCTSLTSITVASDNPVYDSRDNCNAIIHKSSNKLISGCKTTTIPNTVTAIGDDAFYHCKDLTSVIIPKSVTSIGYDAFEDCTGLTSINIPNSVTTIGNSAFSNCQRLKDVYSYIKSPSLVTMGTDVFFRYPANYGERTLHVPAGSLEAYQTDTKWTTFFGFIVEMESEAVLAESIKLNVTTAGLNEGATLQLTANVLPEECADKTVLWASNNPNIASVDSNGLVTTHGMGTATITAITTDGSNLSATCTVTLLPVGVKGDVNGDSKISITDVTDLIDYLLTGSWN